jgi:hypothetical protein
MPTTIIDLNDLTGAIGRDLGATKWRKIEPLQLTLFAAATVSPPLPEEVPAYLVLSLTNLFMPELLEVRGAASGVNYGTGQVRFPRSIRPGDRVRGRAVLADAAEVSGGVQTTVDMRIEVDGDAEPACTVESISRWLR